MKIFFLAGCFFFLVASFVDLNKAQDADTDQGSEEVGKGPSDQEAGDDREDKEREKRENEEKAVLATAELAAAKLAAADSVELILDRIESACLLDGDNRLKIFLRRIAYVESEDGLKAGFDSSKGGIWQVTQDHFDAIENMIEDNPSFAESKEIINRKFSIEINKVTYNDLSNPVQSAIFALLYIRGELNNNHNIDDRVPAYMVEQSKLYTEIYNSQITAASFVTESIELTSRYNKGGADVMFVINTASETELDLNSQVLDLIRIVIEDFKLDDNKEKGTEEFRFGLIMNGRKYIQEFNLNKYFDGNQLEQKIDLIKFPTTNSPSSFSQFQKALERSFSNINGARPVSEGFRRIVVLINLARHDFDRLQFVNQLTRWSEREGLTILPVNADLNGEGKHLSPAASYPMCANYVVLRDLDADSSVNYYGLILSDRIQQAPLYLSPTKVSKRLTIKLEPNFKQNFVVRQTLEGLTMKITYQEGAPILYLGKDTFPGETYNTEKLDGKDSNEISKYIDGSDPFATEPSWIALQNFNAKEITVTIDYYEGKETACMKDNKCQNGAKCENYRKDQIKCICTAGFERQYCDKAIEAVIDYKDEVEANACKPNPCQNNGKCRIKDFGGYKCECDRRKFRGQICDIPV